MKYNLKTVFNPREEEFTFQWDGEDYAVPANGIALFPEFLADHAAKQLANQLLWDDGKEIDDAARPYILRKIFSHPEYEIVDLTEKEDKKGQKKTKKDDDEGKAVKGKDDSDAGKDDEKEE